MNIINALKSGEQLDNPKKAKDVQYLTTLIGGIVYFGTLYLPVDIRPDKDLADLITNVIVAVLVIVNGYITVASSKKMGM